ncbi:hypothetical protein KIW84_051177 [Lathyrus oleraceus]|uniref:Reverse transcriptase/retrotransposon-derived protein RNase H-like domain-containing protein n=1 Tax=Pisum sativum TaxID=3888 RepID=A0A9D5AAC9_PEA|nr:hypothetical protein KIW84_051177 [Pisum sativum]
MHFSQGKYQPQPHIAQELLNFPDENLTVKQIQQFFGIINYIRDFLPRLAKYTSPLSQMLKKKPPPWGTMQTEAVKSLKKIAQTPPALKIPGNGKRILQTDASDHYWGAVLIEELEGKRYYCGHASGQFKEAEKHYHTTYKEALAVKMGIQKFDFHLRGYQFEVQMDNSSFPKILEFKNKMSPDPQTLRLKDWFSRYDFSVKHIKGTQNVIPDLLSRPMKPVQIITTKHTFPLILMVKPLPVHASTTRNLPPGITVSSSPSQLKQYARNNLFYYMTKIIRNKLPDHTPYFPDTPFLLPILINPNVKFTKNHLWYIWCATVLYFMPVLIPTKAMYQHLMNPENHKSLIWTTLEWYSPLQWWRSQLKPVIDEVKERRLALEAINKLKSVFFLHRPYQTDPETKRPEVGESSTQAIQQDPDSPMEAEFSEGQVEEANRKLMDHTYMMDDIWQHESPRYGDCFSDENLSDQNMSPSHEPIFKD